MKTPRFKPGDRVKHAECVLRPKWEYYHAQGEYTAKNRAKRWYEEAKAERGTVLESGWKEQGGGWAKVQWDGAGVSECLDYRIERAEG